MAMSYQPSAISCQRHMAFAHLDEFHARRHYAALGPHHSVACHGFRRLVAVVVFELACNIPTGKGRK
jgi:hypothetical protein